MDYAQEVYLMIGVAAVILIAFALTVLSVMVIYRKRKLEHIREIDKMNEHFSRELLQTQLEVQQQTMQHIGREIHDNVGQKLTLAALYVLQLDEKDTGIQKKIHAVSAIINESLSDLRSLSKDLTDLYQLISNECTRVQATGRCTVKLQARHMSIKATQAVKNVTLRILQEFLQNSLKHADCTAIDIELQQEENGLEIRAADNGKGFIMDAHNRQKGIGLSNMTRRAEIINARLTVESIPGKGTAMRLFIPFTG